MMDEASDDRQVGGQEPSVTCPTRATLLEIVNETISVESDLTAHLEVCEACQQTLQELSELESMQHYHAYARHLNDVTSHLEPPLKAGDLGAVGGLGIESVIGRGGMGVVYKGRDDRLGRTLAIKILARGSSHQSRLRFEREAKALSQLEHPHVVAIYAAGETADGRPWLSMPLVEGESLKQRIGADGLEIQEAARIVRQVAEGLSAAHAAGLIHRDVKPANILLDHKSGLAKLADFGLVRVENGETMTRTDILCGTPEYMSPEQASNPHAHDARGDVYSLGVTLYECLTGTPPFRGQPLQVVEQHLCSEPIPPRRLRPAVPIDLQNICLMAMAREPHHRYQTALELSDDLQRFLSGKPVRAREVTRTERLWRWCHRNRVLASLVATSVGLLLALGVGSSIAAWRLNAANLDLQHQRQKADLAEQRARQDRTVAVNALGNLVDSVYEDLTDDGASVATRAHVTNAAISGLKSIADVAHERDADRTFFQAHLRIADLASLKGDNAEAEENYSTAVELARGLIGQSPQAESAQSDLALAIGKLSTHYFKNRHANAEDYTLRAIQQFEEILHDNPEDLDARVQLLVLQVQQLELLRLNAPQNPALLIDRGAPLLDAIEAIHRAAPASSKVCQLASQVHFLVGRAYLESNVPGEAEQHFAEGRRLLEQPLKQTPNNLQLRSEAAVLDRAHGMALGALGRLGDAVALFESATTTLRALSAADPSDLTKKANVANTLVILSMAYQFAGEFDRAIQVSHAALATYREIIASNPDDHATRVQLVNGLAGLADTQLLANRWEDATATLSEGVTVLAGLPQNESLVGTVSYFRQKLLTSMDVLRLLRGEEFEAENTPAENMALFWVARADAMTAGTLALSPDALARVSSISPGFDGTTFEELFDYRATLEGVPEEQLQVEPILKARVYGLVARSLSTNAGPDDRDGAAEAVTRSLDAIREFADAFPERLSDTVMNDPDLSWLRQTDEFKACWADLQRGGL